MKLCVLDCSFALTLVFEDAADPVADALVQRLEKGDSVVVPAVVWSLEVATALRSAVRRKRLTPQSAEQRRQAFDLLPVVDAPCSRAFGDRLRDLMGKYDLTSQDACYLCVAVEHGLPLATVDQALEEAARRESVPLFRDVFGRLDPEQH